MFIISALIEKNKFYVPKDGKNVVVPKER